MIICSFISREALKTSSFSEKSIWLKKKHTQKTHSVWDGRFLWIPHAPRGKACGDCHATITFGYDATWLQFGGVSSLPCDLLPRKEILRKYPNGYLYVEGSSEQFFKGRQSTAQKKKKGSCSNKSMDTNEQKQRWAPQGKTGHLMQLGLPPRHVWRTGPNADLCGGHRCSLGSSAQALFALPLFLVHAVTTISTLASTVPLSTAS